jgi:hypothetical protein
MVFEKSLLEASIKLLSLLTEHLKYSDLSLSNFLNLVVLSGEEILGKLPILLF